MSLLYVNEDGAVIGLEANRCMIKYKDGLKRSIPIESLEGVTILGKSQVTDCLYGRIPKEGNFLVLFF